MGRHGDCRDCIYYGRFHRTYMDNVDYKYKCDESGETFDNCFGSQCHWFVDREEVEKEKRKNENSGASRPLAVEVVKDIATSNPSNSTLGIIWTIILTVFFDVVSNKDPFVTLGVLFASSLIFVGKGFLIFVILVSVGTILFRYFSI